MWEEESFDHTDIQGFSFLCSEYNDLNLLSFMWCSVILGYLQVERKTPYFPVLVSSIKT